MKNGKLQCKDIPDAPILEFLTKLPPYPGQAWPRSWATFFDDDPGSIFHAMPAGTPPNLARAKIAMLARRGLVDACLCGCRGDIELTNRGWAFMGLEKPVFGTWNDPGTTADDIEADIRKMFSAWANAFDPAERHNRPIATVGTEPVYNTARILKAAGWTISTVHPGDRDGYIVLDYASDILRPYPEICLDPQTNTFTTIERQSNGQIVEAFAHAAETKGGHARPHGRFLPGNPKSPRRKR